MTLVKLGRVDEGKLIEVQIDDEIRVHLQESPTTGFEWILESNDCGVLSLQKVEYYIPKEKPVGGGGQKVFYFQGKNKGIVQPQFKLCRPWLEETSARDRYSITIKIDK